MYTTYMFLRRSTVVLYLCSLTPKQLSSTTTAFIQRYSRSSTFQQPHYRCQSSSTSIVVPHRNVVYSNRRLLLRNINNHYRDISNPRTVYVSQRIMSSNDIDASELLNVGTRYQQVRDRVQAIASEVGRDDNVRLVAVSKTKPMSLLEAAYSAGCRHFGENYVQELIEKVETWQNDDKTDVHWHFIGALQSNKCQILVNCCNDITQLSVETISSIKLATKLNNAVSNKLSPSSATSLPVDDTVPSSSPRRLKVYVQVNTSGEDSKSGIEPGNACIELCRYIILECPLLDFRGLMTIGAPGDTSCFTALVQCRDDVLSDLHNNIEGIAVPIHFELSMGMSDDFEQAIHAGSTNVRVGSTIFGQRNYATST